MPSPIPDPAERLRAPRIPLGLQVLACFVAVGVAWARSLDVPFLLDDPWPWVELVYRTRPLVAASFALDRLVSGEATWSFHVVNTLLHLACGLLVLALARDALARSSARAAAARDGLALTLALLWLVHPLQTSAVTYISQRAEILGSLFVLATLTAFARSTRAARPARWRVLALVALALGFASKEIAATAPVLVWLYDWTFVAGGPVRALRARRGFYAALAGVTVLLFGAFVYGLLFAEHSTAGFGLEAPFGALEYARSQPGVVLHYLRLGLWPHPLCFDYGWPVARETREWLPQTLALGALVASALVLLARRHPLGFAGLALFVVLAPTSSFVPIRDLAFEHRMYLPLAGELAFVVAAGWRLTRGVRGAGPALAIAAVLGLVTLTVQRNELYRDPLALLDQTLEVAPRNGRVHVNRGVVLLDRGRVDEAIAAALEGLRHDPRLVHASVVLARAYAARGELDRARPFAERALANLDPSEADRLRLELARATLRPGAGATEAELRTALELAPADAGLHAALGDLALRAGRREEALAHYVEAVRLDPSLALVQANLGGLYIELGRPAEALAPLRAAIELPPDAPEEHFNLGQALLALGRADEALEPFRAAARLAPGLADTQLALARVLLARPAATPSERAEALAAAEAAAAAAPERADVQALLARARAAAERK